MECKSCGSVKFKKIRCGLYECEYCGRQNEISNVLRVDNPTHNYFDAMFGYVIPDPTRTINELILEREQLELKMKIEDSKIKIDFLQKQNKKIKRSLQKIRKLLR